MRQNLAKITGQQSLDQLDYALKLMHGAWMSTVESRTIQQILDSVECEGKPSILCKSMLELETVPVWLSDLIHGNPAFNGVQVSVECARVKVRCNGFEATASVMLFNKTPDQNELNNLTNPLQLINFVIKKAQAELS